MSGPKVVRIVTREEVIQTCQQLLHRLDCAISQWLDKRTSLGGDIAHDLALFKQQRQQLQSLLDTDQFVELQKAVPLVITSLEVNITDRREQMIQQQMEQRQRQRQRKENAAILLQQLQNKNITLPSQLAQQLAAIKNGKSNAEEALHQGFLLLQQAQAPVTRISAQQQALLHKMADGQPAISFDTWQQNNQQKNLSRDQTPVLQKLDRYISEITLIEPQRASTYRLRLEQLDTEPSQSQRQLLLDSLNLDLANDIRHCKQQQSLIARLEQLMAAIQAQQVILPEVTQEKLNQLSEAKLDEIAQLIALCEERLNQHSNDIAANYRRQAILTGLAKLGYEVREGMATAWQEDGKIVLNNPAVPGYGIEVGGQTTSARLQMRPVRFTQVQDRRRDIDVETLWCSDFGKLNQWMANQGCALELERSLAVGQVPVKYIASEEQPEAAITRQKKLR